jgi:hypothetical protein
MTGYLRVTLMLVTVAINGEKLFEWEGNADAVSHIDEAAARIASIGNVTLQALWESVLLNIVRSKGFSSSNPEAEMMLVLWGIISTPTDDPDHPGAFRHYMSAWDFNFDIEIDEGRKRFKVNAKGAFTAQASA